MCAVWIFGGLTILGGLRRCGWPPVQLFSRPHLVGGYPLLVAELPHEAAGCRNMVCALGLVLAHCGQSQVLGSGCKAQRS